MISLSIHNKLVPFKMGNYTAQLVATVSEIANVVENKAKAVYMSKRKTERLPSLIFSSIGYEIKEANAIYAKAIVFLGGPNSTNPKYAVYVNDGHTLRNGKWWEGYHFMEEGEKEGEAQKNAIMMKHFKFI